MQVLHLDTEKLSPQIVETPGGLPEWYRLCNCDLIDITHRKIAGRYFDIIFDDEGLMKGQGKITALDPDGRPALVGNLVVCNYDPETGGECGLSDDDINHLIQSMVVLTENVKENPRRWLAFRDVTP